jgi:hypothetical protein
MNARKLNLQEYPIGNDANGTPGMYLIREAAANVLMSPTLQLNGAQLLTHASLAQRIQDCKESVILLENSEHQLLVNAINTARGFGKWDVEFVSRVLNAPVVDVTEK